MSGEQSAVLGPHAGLLAWLSAHRVHFELHEHPTTFTARETARVEHVNLATFAKAIGVVSEEGKKALFVLDAEDHVDLLKARRILGGTRVRLMSETELGEAFEGCDVGATPAVGELFGLPTFVDDAIRGASAITFHAGTHRHSVLVDRSDWERAIHARYADLAEHRAAEPAWMRS